MWLQNKEEQIILGSGSPRRQELLQQMGLKFIVDKSQNEEIPHSTAPSQVVMELAEQKAREVAARHTDGTLVIGADTIVALDDRILGKPADEAEAFSMLKSLQGRHHQVYTGVCLIRRTGEEIQQACFYECTQVHVIPMTDAEIQAYVDTKDPLDKAGSYGIQGLFAPYISGIEGDYYNVVGLPVSSLYQHLFR